MYSEWLTNGVSISTCQILWYHTLIKMFHSKLIILSFLTFIWCITLFIWFNIDSNNIHSTWVCLFANRKSIHIHINWLTKMLHLTSFNSFDYECLNCIKAFECERYQWNIQSLSLPLSLGRLFCLHECLFS